MNNLLRIYLRFLKNKPVKIRAVCLVIFLLLLVVSIDFGLANIHKNSSLEKEERNESCGTVTDIDGNVYETVLVAGECWIKSNLKVKHYRNGDPIPEIRDPQAWINTRAGAWCYYDNDPANEEKYGLLYNFYAVTDPRGLAPEGWEVPPICTYQNLMNYYGYNKSGDKIKDPNEWPPHFNTNPDNESGLTVIPGGIRTDQLGGSMFQGNSRNQYVFGFWTRSSFDLNIAFNAFSNDVAPFFNLAYFSKLYGLSVRTTKTKDPPQDPFTMIPEEIFECNIKNVWDFMRDFPALVDRPYCLNSPFRDEYWNDSYMCYDLDRVKIYKADISSNPMRLEDRFEYDVPYYFLIGNISSFDFGRTVETCNVEYKVIVFKKPVIPAPVGESEQSFCRSAKISDFSVSGENLVWYDDLEGGNTLVANTTLEDGKFYYASKKPTGCEIAERLRIKANVHTSDAPTGVAVQEFCYSAIVEDLVVSGDNIVWIDSNGNTLNSSDILMDNGIYRAISKAGDCESGSFEVKVVLKTTASPQATPVQQFCDGARLSEIVIDGTSVNIFENEASTVPLEKESLMVFDREYFASQIINGCESKERTRIRVDLKEISPPSADESQAFCNRATVSNLGINGENIKWYRDQSMTEQIGLDFNLNDGAFYFATQTVDGCESPPLRVAVTINSIEKPGGEAVQVFCGFAKVSDLEAIGTAIRWFRDRDGVQPLGMDAQLEDGGLYYGSQTIGACESAERLIVRADIQRPDVPKGESVQEFCYTAIVEDLVVEGNNVLWYDSEGNSLVSSATLRDNGIYRAVSRAGDCESGSFEVKVGLKTTASPQATPVQQFCDGANLSEIKIDGTSVNIYESEASTVPLDKESLIVFYREYFASQILNGCESKERTRIRVDLKEIPPPSGEESQVFCNWASVSDLRIGGDNIRWYRDQWLTEQIGLDFNLNDGTIYFATQTVDGCESPPFWVAVSINSVEKPNGDAVQVFCGSAKISDLEAIGTAIRWFKGKDDVQPLSKETQVVDGELYYASQTIGSCESAERLSVRVNIYRPELPRGEIFQKVCEGSTIADLLVDGSNLMWYKDVQGPDVLLDNTIMENGFTYYVSQSIEGCESGRFGVMVEIVPSLSPIAEGKQTFCESSRPKVKDLFAVGEKVLWYRTDTEISPLSDEEPLQDGIIYYASNFNSLGCESSLRSLVEVIVNVCEVEVFNLVTLDGNNKNAYFKIKDIEHFPNNRLEIFNRYGVLVYAMNGYGQDERYFYGESNMNNIPNASNGLPTGNYLYILTYRMPIDEKIVKVSGYLHLINAKNQKR